MQAPASYCEPSLTDASIYHTTVNVLFSFSSGPSQGTCHCSDSLLEDCVNGFCNVTKSSVFGCRISRQYFPSHGFSRVYYFCPRSLPDYLINCGGNDDRHDVYTRVSTSHYRDSVLLIKSQICLDILSILCHIEHYLYT